MCFSRLLDRNVYNNDNSLLSFETTSGINTAASFCPSLALDILGMAVLIFAMQDCLFDSWHSASLEKVLWFLLLHLSTIFATLFAFSIIYGLCIRQSQKSCNVRWCNAQQVSQWVKSISTAIIYCLQRCGKSIIFLLSFDSIACQLIFVIMSMNK